MRRIKRITVLLRPFFTVSLLNVISFRAPEIHLDSIKLIPSMVYLPYSTAFTACISSTGQWRALPV